MTEPVRETRQTRELLAALLQGPAHGYQLAQATRRAPGAVYTSLKHLAAEGWVDSHLEPNPIPGKPDRRIYQLTLLGRLHAERLNALDTPEQQ